MRSARDSAGPAGLADQLPGRPPGGARQAAQPPARRDVGAPPWEAAAPPGAPPWDEPTAPVPIPGAWNQAAPPTAPAPAADAPAADGPAARAPSARALGDETQPRSPGPPPPRARARRGGPRLAQLPYLIVIACTAAGCLWAWRGQHDVGSGAEVVGGGLLAAAIGRLLLPHSAAGLLASRRRFIDVLTLGALGAGLVALALVLPPT
jgi:hypothetical protein